MEIILSNFSFKPLLTIFFAIFCLSLLSQNGELVMEKKGSSKERKIPNEKRISVSTQDGTKYKGSLNIAGDGLILVEKDTIALNEITKIRNKSRAGQISGLMVVGIGSGITTLGIVMLTQLTKEGLGAALIGIIIGIPITFVGGITTIVGLVTLAIGKKYKPNKWDYTIVFEGP